MSGLWLVSYMALWILFVLLVIVVLGLVRQLGALYARLGPEENVLTTREGLEIGSPAPDFHAFDVLNRRELALADLKGQQSVMVFVSPSCPPCLELMPHFADFQRSKDGKVNIVLINQSDSQASLELAKAHKLRHLVLADPEKAISTAYKVRVTPYAYRLDKEGLVQRRGVVSNPDGLEDLLKDIPPSELMMVELPRPEKEPASTQAL